MGRGEDGFAFIGVDLAWKSDANPSALAVLHGNRGSAARSFVSDPLCTLKSVLKTIRNYSGQGAIVAIDAPLIIPNIDRQRLCEGLVSQRYGRRHASCHATNLTLYPEPASVSLAQALEADGFVHAGTERALTASCVMLEVFPHAALVALFNLDRIIKYKKGPVRDRRAGLDELRIRIRELADFDPPLAKNEVRSGFLARELSLLRGRELKHYEDGLDAIICAYIAY